MKPFRIALFLILGLFLSHPIYAEMYKYVDEKGQTRWTDDLTQVPVAQRENAERYESVPAEQPSSLTDLENPQDATAEISRAALEKEKAELDSRYQSLTKERQELEKLRAEETDAEGREALRTKIAEYNKKTEQYENELYQFNEKVNAYNQKVLPKPPKDN